MADLRTYLSETAQRELDSLRSALDARLLALENALAHPDAQQSLESLIIDLAHVASDEAHTAAARKWLEAQLAANEHAAKAASVAAATPAGGIPGALLEETAALRRELEQVKTTLERERERSERLRQDAEVAHKATLDERAASAALDGELAKLRSTNDELATQLSATTEKWQAAQQQLEAARAAVESANAAAQTAADDRDANRSAVGSLRVEVELAQNAAREARAKSDDLARKLAAAADALAAESARARDIEAELTAERARATAGDEMQRRLAAADARIKDLELQLFGRDKPTPGADADVDLAAMLEDPAPSGEKPIRRFSRYSFRSKIEVHVGDDAAELVDLSIGGAQLLSATALEVNREAPVALVSDEIPVSCRGKVVWSRVDPHSKGRAKRYRAGILFTDADPAAIEAFIIRYSAT